MASRPVPQSRVIGGQDAEPGAWPWQVKINVHDMTAYLIVFYVLPVVDLLVNSSRNSLAD